MGDDEACKIVGMGKVHIKLNSVNEWLLKDVRHIPSMKRNMISIRKLRDNDCLSTFGKKLRDNDCLSTFGKMWWKITKGALVITK